MADARSTDGYGTGQVLRPGQSLVRQPKNPIHRTPCSEVTAFCVCPQYQAFGYEMGLKAADEMPARAIGTLVHVGLAYRYGALLPQRPEWMVYPDARTALWTIAQGNYEAAEIALKVFDAYQAHYPVERSVWRPTAVEQQFEIMLDIDGVPERYTLRLDLIAQSAFDGVIELIDHKCLPGDCVVPTFDGLMRVDELLTDWKSVSFGGSNTLTWRPARAPIHAGVQDTYRISTKSGIKARFGWKHPVLTQRGFVPARDLVPGDKIAAAAALPDRADAPISDSLITIAGLLIADGGLKHGNVISYTKTSPIFRKLYTSALEAEGMHPGRGGGRTKYLARPARAGKAPYVSISNNSVVFQRLEALGLERVGSAEKRVPVPLLSMSSKQAAILIGAFWSSDGAMYTVKERGSRKVRIVYGSRSYGLCCDIRSLFQQLGILTTVTSSSVAYKGSRRRYHFTTIVGRDSKRIFLEMIVSGEIPRPGGAKIARDLLVLLDEKAATGKNAAADGDLYWDTVESVLFAGKAACYDIEVPENHTFVADGLVTHNTVYKLSKNIGNGYATDREMLTALAMARAAGINVERIVINAMTKGTRERPMPEFERYYVPISADAYARLGADTIYWIRQIRTVKAAYPDPTNRPRAYEQCVRKFGVCDYNPVCTHGPQRLAEFTKKW